MIWISNIYAYLWLEIIIFVIWKANKTCFSMQILLVSLTTGSSWQSRRKDITLLELRWNENGIGNPHYKYLCDWLMTLALASPPPIITLGHKGLFAFRISYLRIEFAFALVSAGKVINAPGPKFPNGGDCSSEPAPRQSMTPKLMRKQSSH